MAARANVLEPRSVPNEQCRTVRPRLFLVNGRATCGDCTRIAYSGSLAATSPVDDRDFATRNPNNSYYSQSADTDILHPYSCISAGWISRSRILVSSAFRRRRSPWVPPRLSARTGSGDAERGRNEREGALKRVDRSSAIPTNGGCHVLSRPVQNARIVARGRGTSSAPSTDRLDSANTPRRSG